MATRYEPKAKYQFKDRVFVVGIDKRLSRNKISQVYNNIHTPIQYRLKYKVVLGALKRIPESAFFVIGEEIKAPFVHKNGAIEFYSVPGLIMKKEYETLLRKGGEVIIDGKRVICKEPELKIPFSSYLDEDRKRN